MSEAAQIVEGYKASSAAQGGTGDVSWIDGMRTELRREMIRELATQRIKMAAPKQNDGQSRLVRIVESVIIGVSATIVSTWVISKIWGGRKS